MVRPELGSLGRRLPAREGRSGVIQVAARSGESLSLVVWAPDTPATAEATPDQPSPVRSSSSLSLPSTGLRDSPTEPASGSSETAAPTATDSSIEA